MKLTPKQEKFAQAIFRGMRQTDAYAHAYDTQADRVSLAVRGYELAHNPKVRDRITELQQLVTDQELLTRSQAVQESLTNLELARQEKQIAAANGAVKLAAELSGLTRPEESSVNVTTITINHS